MEEQNSTGQKEEKKRPAKRTPSIEIKLSSADYMRFSELCRAEGKNRTEVARAAIREYMTQKASGRESEERDRLAQVLEAMQAGRKKDTERLAKMLARVMMDIGIVNQVFYKRAAKEERDALWGSARQSAIERLKHKKKDGDPEATELMEDALSS